MNRHIAYQATMEPWTPGDYFKQVLRGLTAGLIISLLVSAGIWVLSVGISWKVGGPDSFGAAFCQWLYDGSIGSGLRESQYMFPIVEGAHLLGIALSVGMLCWFDLRLLGLILRDEPVSKVWKQVMPTAFVGFALMFVTGVFLFLAEAITAYHSVHFWIKMALLVLAGVNAVLFESAGHRDMREWDAAPIPPLRFRMNGLISLVLWTAIIIMGRTMAYTF